MRLAEAGSDGACRVLGVYRGRASPAYKVRGAAGDLASHPRNAVVSLGEKRCLADVVLLRQDEFVFGLMIRDGQEATQTDGIKRAIGVASVRKEGFYAICHCIPRLKMSRHSFT